MGTIHNQVNQRAEHPQYAFNTNLMETLLEDYGYTDEEYDANVITVPFYHQIIIHSNT